MQAGSVKFTVEVSDGGTIVRTSVFDSLSTAQGSIRVGKTYEGANAFQLLARPAPFEPGTYTLSLKAEKAGALLFSAETRTVFRNEKDSGSQYLPAGSLSFDTGNIGYYASSKSFDKLLLRRSDGELAAASSSSAYSNSDYLDIPSLSYSTSYGSFPYYYYFYYISGLTLYCTDSIKPGETLTLYGVSGTGGAEVVLRSDITATADPLLLGASVYSPYTASREIEAWLAFSRVSEQDLANYDISLVDGDGNAAASATRTVVTSVNSGEGRISVQVYLEPAAPLTVGQKLYLKITDPSGALRSKTSAAYATVYESTWFSSYDWTVVDASRGLARVYTDMSFDTPLIFVLSLNGVEVGQCAAETDASGYYNLQFTNAGKSAPLAAGMNYSVAVYRNLEDGSIGSGSLYVPSQPSYYSGVTAVPDILPVGAGAFDMTLYANGGYMVLLGLPRADVTVQLLRRDTNGGYPYTYTQVGSMNPGFQLTREGKYAGDDGVKITGTFTLTQPIQPDADYTVRIYNNSSAYSFPTTPPAGQLWASGVDFNGNYNYIGYDSGLSRTLYSVPQNSVLRIAARYVYGASGDVTAVLTNGVNTASAVMTTDASYWGGMYGDYSCFIDCSSLPADSAGYTLKIASGGSEFADTYYGITISQGSDSLSSPYLYLRDSDISGSGVLRAGTAAIPVYTYAKGFTAETLAQASVSLTNVAGVPFPVKWTNITPQGGYSFVFNADLELDAPLPAGRYTLNCQYGGATAASGNFSCTDRPVLTGVVYKDGAYALTGFNFSDGAVYTANIQSYSGSGYQNLYAGLALVKTAGRDELTLDAAQTAGLTGGAGYTLILCENGVPVDSRSLTAAYMSDETRIIFTNAPNYPYVTNSYVYMQVVSLRYTQWRVAESESALANAYYQTFNSDYTMYYYLSGGDGAKTLYFQLKDAAGGERIFTRGIILNSVADDIVSIKSPAANALCAGALDISLEVKNGLSNAFVEFYDNYSMVTVPGVTGANGALALRDFDPGTKTWTASVAIVQAMRNVNELRFYLVDGVGIKSQTRSVYVTLDPVSYITFTGMKAWYNTNGVSVRGFWAEGETVTLNVTPQAGGAVSETAVCGAGGYFTKTFYLPDGNYTVTASCGGVSGDATPSFTVDTVKPIVKNLRVTNQTYTTVSFAWDVDDANPSYCMIYRDGVLIEANYAAGSYMVVDLDLSETGGKAYVFRIAAVDGAGNVSEGAAGSSLTVEGKDTAAPTKPDVVITGVTGKSVKMTFSSFDNSGVADYTVYRDGAPVATVTASEYKDANLVAGTSYIYTVTARDAAGNISGASEPVTATPQNPRIDALKHDQPGDTVSYPEVTGVSFTAEVADTGNGSGLTAEFFYKQGGADSQDAYVSAGKYDVPAAAGGVFTFTQALALTRDMAVSGAVTVKVLATDDDGCVGEATATLMIDADTTPPEVDFTGLDPALTYKGAILLKAAASDNAALAYVEFAYYDDALGAYTVIGRIPMRDLKSGTAEYAFDTGTLPADRTSLTVRATAADLMGNTGEKIITLNLWNRTPGAVANLKIEEISDTEAKLTWDAATGEYVAGYRVYRSENGGSFSMVGDTADLFYTDGSLKADSGYAYYVTAYDGKGGVSQNSDAVGRPAKDRTPPEFVSLSPKNGDSVYGLIRFEGIARDDTGLMSIRLVSAYFDETIPLSVAAAPFSYGFDSSALAKEDLTVTLTLTDGSGNEQTETLLLHIDNTIQQPPSNLQAAQADDYAVLTWKNPASLANINVYTIEWDQAQGKNSYTLIRALGKTESYIDETVEYGKSYRYGVSAVSQSGVESVIIEAEAPVGIAKPPVEAPMKINAISPSYDSFINNETSVTVSVKSPSRLTSLTLSAQTASGNAVIDTLYDPPYTGVYGFSKGKLSGLADGEYTFTVNAVCADGQVSKTTVYNVDLKIPEDPEVYLAANECDAYVSWSKSDADVVGYTVYRARGSSGFVPLAIVMSDEFGISDLGLIGGEYTYKVIAKDAAGNLSPGENAVSVFVDGLDTEPPAAVILPGDQKAAKGAEVIFSAERSSDNVGIVSRYWDFGDGTGSVNVKPTHTYTQTGIKTVSLTVSDRAGNKDTAYCRVEVTDDLNVMILTVTGGAKAPAVLVPMPDGSETTFLGDDTGKVTISLPPGQYAASVKAAGYMMKRVVLDLGSQYSADPFYKTISLDPNDYMKLVFSQRRLTPDEAAEKGININDPANVNTSLWTVNLEFNKVPITAAFIPGHAGSAVVTGSQGYGVACGSLGKSDDGTTKGVYLLIYGETSWTKEFFDATLILINTSPEELKLDITDLAAEMDPLPDGLSLASVSELRREIGTLKGGETASAEWILRGDKQGEYMLGGSVKGKWADGSDLNMEFRGAEPIKVWSGSALRMIVTAPKYAAPGKAYNVRLDLQNKSDVELYNVNLKVDGTVYREAYTLEDMMTVPSDLRAGDSVNVPVLKPGQSLTLNVNTSFAEGIDLDADEQNAQYQLMNAFSLSRPGSNAEVEIVFAWVDADSPDVQVKSPGSADDGLRDVYFRQGSYTISPKKTLNLSDELVFLPFDASAADKTVLGWDVAKADTAGDDENSGIVAEFTKPGTIRGVSEGKAVVTAIFANGLTAQCVISVEGPERVFEFAPDNITLKLNEYKTVPLVHKNVGSVYTVFVRQDSMVLTAEQFGEGVDLHAVSAGGAIVVVTVDGVTAELFVTVEGDPDELRSMSFTRDTYIFWIEKQPDLNLNNLLVFDSKETSHKRIKEWISSDPDVCTVSAGGKLWPKNSGSVTITAVNAYDESIVAECTVDIEMPTFVTKDLVGGTGVEAAFPHDSETPGGDVETTSWGLNTFEMGIDLKGISNSYVVRYNPDTAVLTITSGLEDATLLKYHPLEYMDKWKKWNKDAAESAEDFFDHLGQYDETPGYVGAKLPESEAHCILYLMSHLQNGMFDKFEGCIGFEYKGSLGAKKMIYPAVFVDATFEGEWRIGLTAVIDDFEIEPLKNIELEGYVETALTGILGGEVNLLLAKARIEGSVGISASTVIASDKDILDELKVKGSIGLSFEYSALFELFKREVELYSDEFELYPEGWKKFYNSIKSDPVDGYEGIPVGSGRPTDVPKLPANVRARAFTARNDSVLISNAGEIANPQVLALPGGNKIMTWCGNVAGRDDYNWIGAYYSLYDAKTGMWSAPALVSDDGTIDANPRPMLTSGGEVFVVWQNCTEILTQDTVGDITGSMAVNAARVDAATGEVESVSAVGQGGHSVLSFAVIGDGIALLSNDRQDALLYDGNNSYSVAVYDGASRSFTAGAWNPIDGKMIGGMGMIDGKPAYCYYEGGGLDDMEAFINAGGDTFPGFSPVYLDDGSMVYLKDIANEEFGSVTTEIWRYTAEGGSERLYAGGGMIPALYAAQGGGMDPLLYWIGSDGVSQVVTGMLLNDGIADNKPVAILDDGSSIGSICAYAENGQYKLVYLRNVLKPNAGPTGSAAQSPYAQSDIVECSITPGDAFQIADGGVWRDETDVQPNTTLTMHAAVENTGLTEGCPIISVTDQASGAVLYSGTMTQSVLPGNSKVFDFRAPMPDDVSKLVLDVRAHAAGQFSARKTSLRVNPGAVTVTGARLAESGEDRVVLADVRNIGYEDVRVEVRLYQGVPNSQPKLLLSQQVVVSARETLTVPFMLSINQIDFQGLTATSFFVELVPYDAKVPAGGTGVVRIESLEEPTGVADGNPDEPVTLTGRADRTLVNMQYSALKGNKLETGLQNNGKASDVFMQADVYRGGELIDSLSQKVRLAAFESKAVSWDVSGLQLTGDETLDIYLLNSGYVDLDQQTEVPAKDNFVPVESVTALTREITLEAGSQGYLEAEIQPLNATDKNLEWKSDNPAAATVKNGVVTAIAAGDATVTAVAEDGGAFDTFTVHVVASEILVPVTGVSLGENSMSLYAGDAATLNWTVTPDNASDKRVRFASSNDDVATVDENGAVSAHMAGVAEITVTTETGGFTDVCEVRVLSAPAGQYSVTVKDSCDAQSGAGRYEAGETVTIRAGSRSGYVFAGWVSQGGVALTDAKSAVTTFTMPEVNVIVTATWRYEGNGGGNGGGGPAYVYQQPSAPARSGETAQDQPDGPAAPTVPRLDKDRIEAYISGYPDGTFRAGNGITRYEAAMIFYALMPEADREYYKANAKLPDDAAAGQWYSEAVAGLVAAGVIAGYEDGSYKGGNEITRAEFVTIASKFGELNLTGGMPFSDVPDGHWAYDFIKSAYNDGWISGYPDGTFGIDRKITRAEAVTVVNKMMGWGDKTPPQNIKIHFADLKGDEWYFIQVTLAANGI